MPKWQIGDRVICTVDHPEGNKGIVAGMTGYVCSFNEWRAEMGFSSIGVCWDENIGSGHNCADTCEWGHGWYMREESIAEEPVSDFEVATDDELMGFIGIVK